MSGRTMRRPDPVARLLASVKGGRSADVRVLENQWTTIRFAGGRIHQPHVDRATVVSFRVADDRRLGVATTTDVSPDGLDRLSRSAHRLAAVAPREPSFPGFPAGRGPARPVPWSASTAEATPDAACRAAERLIASALTAASAAEVAGALHLGGQRIRVANTSGLDREDRTSVAQASVLAERPERDPPVSGWSEGASWDLRRLDLEEVGTEAGERMPTSAPEACPAGTYRVVLRGPAVAETLAFLAHLGFTGGAEVDGSSCLRTWRGRRLGPTSLTVTDDPRSPATLPRAIDYEGKATGRFALLDEGRVGPAVADLVAAGRLHRRPTGHAFPPEAPWGTIGGLPAHVILRAGSASEEELVRETRSGVLVSRFHYVRTVDPGSGMITGMTRDGTYRIDRGEIVGPVRNLRFTESVRTVLAGVEGIGRESRTYSGERGQVSQTVPSLAVRSFRFTSATVF